jgi:ssDNA-binding Zn-finger/Zn-ribbon topoisomerase 1
MRRFGWSAILLATLQPPEQEPIPDGRCPECGDTHVVRQHWTEGIGFKACPKCRPTEETP